MHRCTRYGDPRTAHFHVHCRLTRRGSALAIRHYRNHTPTERHTRSRLLDVALRVSLALFSTTSPPTTDRFLLSLSQAYAPGHSPYLVGFSTAQASPHFGSLLPKVSLTQDATTSRQSAWLFWASHKVDPLRHRELMLLHDQADGRRLTNSTDFQLGHFIQISVDVRRPSCH